MTAYSLDNSAAETRQRFTSLQSLLDPITNAHLERTGVADGWRCLEVGGGGGSTARWLAQRVGPTGLVVATDIDDRWLVAEEPNVEVRLHDITRDPIEEGKFDLVHARLVLLHLPERARALEAMVSALRPGGWLVIEDFDCTWLPFAPDADEAGTAVFHKVLAAFHTILARNGADLAHGRFFHRLLAAAGLKDVAVDATTTITPGGSAGALLHLANVDQLRDQLLGDGLVTHDDLDAFRRLVTDPQFSVNSYLLVSATGRR